MGIKKGGNPSISAEKKNVPRYVYVLCIINSPCIVISYHQYTLNIYQFGRYFDW